MGALLDIDGSYGEGGGQILRSALALSLATGTPFALEKIRAGRPRPGLLRQHLTCVKAATAVGDAEVTGAELGSTSLTFRPKALRAGDYSFAIGSAGSTTLVVQTVLVPLLIANGASTLTLTGGTHNSAAPPYDFLERVFFPVLHGLGADVTSKLSRHGFHPAGGGSLVVTIRGPATLAPFSRTKRGDVTLSARVVSAHLSRSVGVRECETLAEALAISRRDIPIAYVESDGPGNVVIVEARTSDGAVELVTTFGERGVRAEDVAAHAARDMKRYVDAGAPVGEHLADQLLLPLALGAGGEFRATCASSHLTTNAWVLRHFLGDVVRIDEEPNGVAHVTVRGLKPRG